MILWRANYLSDSLLKRVTRSFDEVFSYLFVIFLQYRRFYCFECVSLAVTSGVLVVVSYQFMS